MGRRRRAAWREAGLTWVRIGEFAWTRLEPAPGDLDWDWLDRADRDARGARASRSCWARPPPRRRAGCSTSIPTCSPVDAEGRPRGFGSRRHYASATAATARNARRIATALAERYGRNPHVAAWQTDNEYGCHDTTLSLFRRGARGLPRLARAELPVDRRAQSRLGQRVLVDGIRRLRPDRPAEPDRDRAEPGACDGLPPLLLRSGRGLQPRPRSRSCAPTPTRRIIHNYMGRTTDFDHFAVGRRPRHRELGQLPARVPGGPDRRGRRHGSGAYLRQGDPDIQAFHHDLYRAVGRGRWWVMEQQPGPVNWAPYNPAPLPGMVRLWAWEAFAHGAEAVSYFRWRQAPFAQEQMHAGLLRPDSATRRRLAEAAQVARELGSCPTVDHPRGARRPHLRLRGRLGVGDAAAGRGSVVLRPGVRSLPGAASGRPVCGHPAARRAP